LDCSGGHPEWHIKYDVLEVIKGGQIWFQNGDRKYIPYWDMMIAFPPCTYLTVTGARWMYLNDGSINQERKKQQDDAIEFVKQLYNSDISCVGIENSIGILSTKWMKPTQIIQPYYFGDEAQKTTCLWLKNLPVLYHNGESNLFDSNITHVGKGGNIQTSTGKTFSKWYWETSKGKGSERQIRRSKTFPGIAHAMATQWSEYLR
jgi:hypothetical protein